MRLLAIAMVLAGCGDDDAMRPMEDAGGERDAGRDAATPVDSGGPDSGMHDAGPPPPPPPVVVYTTGRGGDLIASTIDADGMLTETSRTDLGGSASFVAIDRAGRHLYAVQEGSDQVVALSIEPGTGVTTVLNRQPSEGGGPTHVSVDVTGAWVLVASYGGGTVAVFPIEADGSLGPAVDVEMAGRNAHQILPHPGGRFVLVPCLGADETVVYRLDGATGDLTRVGAAATMGDGPRHLAFQHPEGRVYVANELDSTVDAFTFDDGTGAILGFDHDSTLATPVAGNTTAEIFVHPDGRALYVSNRGDDSIAVFDVAADGMLALRTQAPLGARTPRSFAIHPDGTLLIAAAQMDDRVVAFRIDAAGDLTRLGESDATGASTFVGIFTIAAP